MVLLLSSSDGEISREAAIEVGGGVSLGGDDDGDSNRRPSFPLVLTLDGEESGDNGSVPFSTKFVHEESLAAAREGRHNDALVLARGPAEIFGSSTLTADAK